MSDFTRRALLTTAAALAASAAVPAFAAAPTPIARAWARAELLRLQLAPHAPVIAAAFRAGGVPGWMRLKGEPNRLGETRYGLLVEMLNTAPTGPADLALQRLAAADFEMRHGPRDWAEARLRLAAAELRRAA